MILVCRDGDDYFENEAAEALGHLTVFYHVAKTLTYAQRPNSDDEAEVTVFCGKEDGTTLLYRVSSNEKIGRICQNCLREFYQQERP